MTASKKAKEHYFIERQSSRFVVRAFAGGILSSFGHNPTFEVGDYSGEVWFDPNESEQASSLTVRVRAKSLKLSDDVSEKDRRTMQQTMAAEVLEVDRYPDIVFDCRQVKAYSTGQGPQRADLVGDLTLHGVSRRLTIPTRFSLLGDSLKAVGEFTLRQSDFNIKLVSVAGSILKVKDELTVSFDILARAAR